MTGTEIVVIVVIVLGGGLLGAAAGFAGALYLEKRSDVGQRRAEVMTLLMEMALLDSTLEAAVDSGMRLREALRRDPWERFHSDLVKWLPWHLVQLLHLHRDLFKTVRALYDRAATQGVGAEELDDVSATFWAYIYRSERLRGLLLEALESSQGSPSFRLLGIPAQTREDQDTFRKLEEELDAGAIEFVRSKGIEPRPPRPLADNPGT
jgi:hypothetical protein